MKMAMNNGQLMIKDADDYQFQIIKSWNKMRWNKAEKMLQAPVESDLLNKLAGIVTLPQVIEQERQRLNAITEAVDAERMNAEPEALYRYPVKLPLFKHQIRGANMCLMTFGLVAPKKKGRRINGNN